MSNNEYLENKLGDWKSQYEVLCRHVEGVHRDVTAGASAVDGGLLTDHGPQHIETVISRASDLIRARSCDLSSYEVFLLLAAIHLHDVGNIHGRTGHQYTAIDVVDWLGAAVSPDAIVRRTIMQLAAAHTAGDSPDKDTIGKLVPETHILNNRVRPRLLAAILRFADELAEERRRASRYLRDTGKLPKGAEVYHSLSHALHSVTIDHESREVVLRFDIDKNDAVRQLGKNGSYAYLLDEILERSKKLHLERMYAMYFVRDWIQLEAIRVFIEVHDNGLEPIEKIGYRLAECGYPTEPDAGVYTLAPELVEYRDWDGRKVTGAELAQRLQDQAT